MQKDIRCNCCGKLLKHEDDIITEGALQLCFTWGYFSKKDGEQHKMIVCENCYDNWVAGFRIPIETLETTELL